MKSYSNKTCAICNIPLKWWNVQTCIYCKKALCCQHSSVLRRSHSSVLFVVCIRCSKENTWDDKRVGEAVSHHRGTVFFTSSGLKRDKTLRGSASYRL